MISERIAIVLGASVRPDGTPSPTLALRVDHACALFARGEVDRILLTGGVGRHGPAEAEVAEARARSRGVPAGRLAVEPRSTSTFENLTEALALLPQDAKLVLVSNRWHLPRACLILLILGRDARLDGPAGSGSWAWTARAILREILATPVTIWRAWRYRRRMPPVEGTR
ncbi:hypothetical protein JSE7799_00797 [Jannaschia seosinensis]|uniref:DUF218 domain-containing protein n=1 Tax=Jannaschia seosinensis TaxID=313367 RepID=A0A0M7B8F2_9RHOB|nr:YdcF family protein [Jannaschia seosinensis]CUH28052.1 hypothetical protein JSE7799_00797 [Jannaschia seosinensis]